ncbi:Ty1/Copia family ribonuclease HI [Aspergillus affinis]|uniref:Ty1/Copia family ribonuclease HI n=1 Tax=Aspergillus affinis TaxID=1070780 RepID=UPI0022FE1DA4|nr:uncharacterized protein KD926_008119 [Aspergillus affinis]KAI9040552.1 hypothetical protein KD926_008119 [Aspergillus affinis]
MILAPALNGDQWISHFYDENTRFHNVFTHRLKSGCVGAFNTYILQMQNIAKTTIKFFKSDHEQTLGNAVKREEALRGIIHEYSVVDTPDQNGAAERAGAILILKARKTMIEAKLPRDLWPWVIGGAANILHDHARQPNTPHPNTINLDPNPDEAPESKKKEYSMKIGSAQYTAMITRPDIAFMISCLSEALKSPSQDHIRAADRVIEYLYNTRFYALEFSAKEEGQEIAIIASDAAYADRPDRRSSAGYLVKLYNGPVEWKSGKQRAVTTSTTEAEFLALSEAAKAVYWWRRVFNTIGFDPQHETTVSCDNQQTVRLVNHEDIEQRSKLRHVDIHRSWLRQEAQRGDLRVQWIPTDRMIADGLTKPLPTQQHHKFMKMLNLVNIKDLILAQEGI